MGSKIRNKNCVAIHNVYEWETVSNMLNRIVAVQVSDPPSLKLRRAGATDAMKTGRTRVRRN